MGENLIKSHDLPDSKTLLDNILISNDIQKEILRTRKLFLERIFRALEGKRIREFTPELSNAVINSIIEFENGVQNKLLNMNYDNFNENYLYTILETAKLQEQLKEYISSKGKESEILGGKRIRLDKEGYDETITVFSLKIDGIPFSGIQVPEKLKEKKFGETYIGEKLQNLEECSFFIGGGFFDKNIEESFIVWQKDNFQDSEQKTWVNISPIDAEREAIEKGFNLISIKENIILTEIVQASLGREYIDFSGYKYNGGEKGFEEKRKKLKDIENLLGLNFSDFSESNYIIRNWGLYEDEDGELRVFVRGGDVGSGVDAGVFSLYLYRTLDTQRDNIGFRYSL